MRHKGDARRLLRQQDPRGGKGGYTGGDRFQKIASSHSGPPVAFTNFYAAAARAANYSAGLVRWARPVCAGRSFALDVIAGSGSAGERPTCCARRGEERPGLFFTDRTRADFPWKRCGAGSQLLRSLVTRCRGSAAPSDRGSVESCRSAPTGSITTTWATAMSRQRASWSASKGYVVGCWDSGRRALDRLPSAAAVAIELLVFTVARRHDRHRRRQFLAVCRGRRGSAGLCQASSG